MSISMEINQSSFDSQSKVSQFSDQKILQSYFSLASVISGQIVTALEWQQFLVHAISYLPGSILTLFAGNIHTQLQLPEIIGEKEQTTRVDVREVDLKDVKIIMQAGGKKGTKRKKNERKEPDKNGKNDENNNNEENRKKEEEKRQKNWEDCWNKKLEIQEARDDEAFCSIHGFYPKPKTQTNIWLHVTYGKLSQDVQLCFKKDPIPKPPPPPLPPLKIEESEPPAVQKDEREKRKPKAKRVKRK